MADKPKGLPPPPSDRDRASTSGIPLQRHLAELVNKSCGGRDQTHPQDRQLWRVEAEEVPAGDGFLDILLICRTQGNAPIRMAVEVKRFYDADEGRPQRLLFLTPRTAARNTNSGPILPYRDPEKTKGRADLPHRLMAGEFYATLKCPVAEHCIFEERKGNVTMDGIARELLAQMEALSIEPVAHGERFAFLPVVVTNAELRLLRVGDVDLTSGAMTSGPENGEVVPWLRYEKTLSRSGLEPVASQGSKDFTSWASERVRSVYVVQALHFIEFLRRLQLVAPPWERRQ
ncbi:MAG: hypothetical protein ACK52I_08000 [Pseudomonadota bacterium]